MTNPTVSEYPVLNDDGSAIGFESNAANLFPGAPKNWNVYLRRRGAPNGILKADVTQQGVTGQISGLATFAGAILSSGTHPQTPAASIEVPGGDIAAADIAERIEQEDLRFRIVVPSLPGIQTSGLAGRLACFEVGCPPSVTDSPYVGYRIEFLLRGVPYRIAVTGTGAVLEDCSAPVCIPVSNVTTSVGTTGSEVVVTVPVSLLASAAGAPVTGIVITSTLLAPAAPAQDVDSLSLPDGLIGTPTIRIGVTPFGVSPQAVQYTSTISPIAGTFSANFNAPADGAAGVLWAKACVGETCGDPFSWPIAPTVPSVTITTITRGADGQVLLEGTALPNQPVTIQASTDLLQTFTTIGSTMSDASGRFHIADADAVGMSRRFYRAVYP